MSPIYPVALWNMSRSRDDWRRIEELRKRDAYDWRTGAVDGEHVEVELPPATEITLVLSTDRFVNEPTCASPVS